MKKTIKNPDGTETVFEGTAEELAELETRIRNGQTNESPKRKKRLLTEEEVRAIAQEEVQKHVCQPVVNIPYVQTFEPCVHDFPSPWLGVVPPNCKKCGMQAAWLTVTTCDTVVPEGLPVKTSCGSNSWIVDASGMTFTGQN